MIEHYPTCHADYPEEARGERPQATTDGDLGDCTIARHGRDEFGRCGMSPFTLFQ